MLATVEHETTGRLATSRLTQADTDHSVVTDLLFASSGIEPEVVAAAESIEIIPGVVVRVATIGHLIALKALARDDRQRPTDADDLRALAAVASDSDWDAAVQAAHLITNRGFHRDRDLVALVRQIRQS